MRRCVAFAGGGSGGHVFPALAVETEIRKRWPGKTVWIGSTAGMEREICSRHGVVYYGIPSGKLRRYFSLANLTDLFRILVGFLCALLILSRVRPSLLFSKGGYVSVPPVVAAHLLGIPVFTHESDFDPGLATKINARFAEQILTSFAETQEYLPHNLQARVICTGNPVRETLLTGDPSRGKRLVGCPADKDMLLVLGGSQGAEMINHLVAEVLDELRQVCFVVHQMGKRNYQPLVLENYVAISFFGEELAHVLAASSLVVSRAGANWLSELAALGKPSVLIPLAHAGSRGDQILNARVFGTAGAAEILEEASATGPGLLEFVRSLIDNRERLALMGKRAESLNTKHSAQMIADLILTRIGHTAHARTACTN